MLIKDLKEVLNKYPDYLVIRHICIGTETHNVLDGIPEINDKLSGEVTLEIHLDV